MPTNGSAKIELAEAIEGYRFAYGPFASLRLLRDTLGKSIVGLDWAQKSGAHTGGSGYRVWRADPSARTNSIGTMRVGSLKSGIIGELERIGDGLLLWSNYHIRGLPMHVDINRVPTASDRGGKPRAETPYTWTDLLSIDADIIEQNLHKKDITRDALLRLTDPEQANLLSDQTYAVVVEYLRTRVAPRAREQDIISALIDSPSYEILLALLENPFVSADNLLAILQASEDMAADDDEWQRILMATAVHPNVGKPTANGETPSDNLVAYATGEPGVLELLWGNDAVPDEKRKLYHSISKDLFPSTPDYPEEPDEPVVPQIQEPVKDWDTSDVLLMLRSNPDMKPQEIAQALDTRDVVGIAKWMRQNKATLPKPTPPVKPKPVVEPTPAPIAPVKPLSPMRRPQPKPQKPVVIKPKREPKPIPDVPRVDPGTLNLSIATPDSFARSLTAYYNAYNGKLPAGWDIEIARAMGTSVRDIKNRARVLKIDPKYATFWNSVPQIMKIYLAK